MRPHHRGMEVRISKEGYNVRQHYGVGWTGDGDELVSYVSNSTQGFTWTLAGLKALLEHNVRLNLVTDRFPKGPEEPYPDE